MEAVARGDEPDQPSVLDSASGLDLAADSGVDASAVDLGSDGNLNSEASLGSGAFPVPGADAATVLPLWLSGLVFSGLISPCAPSSATWTASPAG